MTLIRRLSLPILLSAACISATGCSSLAEIERTLSQRPTPTYLVMTGDQRIEPGVAAYLPSGSVSVPFNSTVGLDRCNMEARFWAPIANYEHILFDGSPIFGGVYWYPHGPYSSGWHVDDPPLPIFASHWFDVLRKVSPSSDVVKFTFTNLVLIRLDDPETFLRFLAMHPGISIDETVEMLRPCREEIQRMNYRHFSHVLYADVQVEFRIAVFDQQIVPSQISSSLARALEADSLSLDVASGTLKSTHPIRIARFGQLRLNSVGRFGPTNPSESR